MRAEQPVRTMHTCKRFEAVERRHMGSDARMGTELMVGAYLAEADRAHHAGHPSGGNMAHLKPGLSSKHFEDASTMAGVDEHVREVPIVGQERRIGKAQHEDDPSFRSVPRQ